jgi:hypothetical protein
MSDNEDHRNSVDNVDLSENNTIEQSTVTEEDKGNTEELMIDDYFSRETRDVLQQVILVSEFFTDIASLESQEQEQTLTSVASEYYFDAIEVISKATDCLT